MENSNAQRIIKSLITHVEANGIKPEHLIPELKKLREFALVEAKPYLVKALRLAYEHLEEHNDFLVGIPSDEPIEDETLTPSENSATESFNYFITLMLDLNNKHNIADIKEYNQSFLQF